MNIACQFIVVGTNVLSATEGDAMYWFIQHTPPAAWLITKQTEFLA